MTYKIYREGVEPLMKDEELIWKAWLRNVRGVFTGIPNPLIFNIWTDAATSGTYENISVWFDDVHGESALVGLNSDGTRILARWNDSHDDLRSMKDIKKKLRKERYDAAMSDTQWMATIIAFLWGLVSCMGLLVTKNEGLLTGQGFAFFVLPLWITSIALASIGASHLLAKCEMRKDPLIQVIENDRDWGGPIQEPPEA